MTTAECTPSCEGGCGFTSPLTTQTGFTIEGGNYSGQAWSVPNQLGCPDSLYSAVAVNQLDARDAAGNLPMCDTDGVVPEGSRMHPTQGRR